jgi:predicted ATPase
MSIGRAFRDVMRAVCAEQPCVLVLDDAQWLDRESLLAGAAIARDLRALPCCLVLTAPSVPDRVELDGLRSRLGREVRGGTITLAALPRDELRALARWALPHYDEGQIDRVVRRVATDSAGLPLLAVELLHAVALGLELGKMAGAWPEPLRTLDQTLPGGFPDAVVGAIRVNYRRLSSDAQTVLAAAAVLGGRVPAERLRRATGLGPDEVRVALDELEWQRWLTAEGRGYTFVARIVQEVVAGDLVIAGQRQRIREAAT